MKIPNYLLSSVHKENIRYLDFVKGDPMPARIQGCESQLREDSGNLTQGKAGSIPDIPHQAGGTGSGTWQLASKKVNISNSPSQLEGSENKHSFINNDEII